MKTNGATISEWVGALDNQQPYYLAVVDEQGQLTFTNSNFYISFQASHPPALPNGFFDLVHENDRNRLNKVLRSLSLSGKPATAEIRIKNGHFHWIKWEISCVQMPETKSERFLFLGLEISEEEQQKKTMEAFEQDYQTTNTLFTSFMDHTPYFTWIMDEDENLLYANRSLLEYFQLDPFAFGKELSSLIPGPIAGIFNEKHKLVLKGHRQDQSMVKCLMSDGKEHVYQVTVFPIHGSAPGIMVGGEAMDVTESYNARRLEKGTAEAIIKAQEDERTRIGHELHDNVNQILSSSNLYLSLLTPGIDQFREIKDKTMEMLQLGMEEIRNLSRSMVMSDLKAGGLVASIKELVEDLRFTKLFNIGFVHSNLCDIESLSQNKKVTLFRIVQEQTKNIVKYSKATNIEISLHRDSDHMRMLIKDDGIGFAPENTRRGLGLSNIYERTRLYKGNVVLSTAPGKGCSVIINIPIESSDWPLNPQKAKS